MCRWFSGELHNTDADDLTLTLLLVREKENVHGEKWLRFFHTLFFLLFSLHFFFFALFSADSGNTRYNSRVYDCRLWCEGREWKWGGKKEKLNRSDDEHEHESLCVSRHDDAAEWNRKKHEENVENQNKVSAYFYVAGGKKWLQMNGGKCEKYGEKMLVFLRLSFFSLLGCFWVRHSQKNLKLAEKLFSFKANREGDDKMICQQRQHCAWQRSHDKLRIFPIFIFFAYQSKRIHVLMVHYIGLWLSHVLVSFLCFVHLSHFNRSPSHCLKHIRVCAGNLSLLKVLFLCVYIKFSLFSFSLISVSVYSLSSSLPRSLSISSVGWLLLVFLSVVCVLSALDNKLYPFSHSFRCLLFLLASSLESDSHLWKTCEYSILPFHSHIHCFFNYAQWNLGSFSREFLTM